MVFNHKSLPFAVYVNNLLFFQVFISICCLVVLANLGVLCDKGCFWVLLYFNSCSDVIMNDSSWFFF